MMDNIKSGGELKEFLNNIMGEERTERSSDNWYDVQYHG